MQRVNPLLVHSGHELVRCICPLLEGELMSALGPKRTSVVAPHMSSFGGKADMGRPYSTLGKSGHPAPH